MSQISQDKVPDFLPHHAERVGKVSQFIQELAELKQKFKDAVEEGPSNYKMVVVMKEQLDSMYRDAIVMNQELFASKHLSGDDFERTKESLIESKESVEAMYQDYLNTNLKSSSKKASSCKSHSSAMKLLELQAKEAEERVQREMERISLEEELELHQLEAEKKKVQQRKKLLMLEAKERASSEIARIKQALVIEEDCETSTVSSLHLPRQHNLAEKSEPGPSEVKITEVSPPLETRIVSQNDPVVSTGPACSRVDFGPIPTSFGKSSACPIASSFAFPRQQVDPIVQTSPSQASNEILDLKKALVEAMTETKNASFRPRVEIDKFNGNPLRFFRFLHQFDSHVGGQFQDSKRKLDLLLSLCTGEALRAIEGCLFLSPDIGYQEARKRLEQRFGQHIVIIEAYVEKLTSGPPIKETDHNGLTSLADDMFNCLMTLRGWGGVASLDLQDNLRKIYSRLPSFSRERFDGVYCKLYKEGRVPTFKDLTEFVQEEATRASTFFKRQHFQAEKAVSKPKSKPVYGSKAAPRTAVKVSTFATQRVDTNVQKGTPLQKPQIACVVCSSQHPLWKCESFKQKSPTERWKIAKSAGACFNCLSTTHKATDCGSRFGCKTCAGRHHTLLHGKFNNEADSVTTSKDTTVASENNEEAKKVAFSVNSKQDARKVKRFKVVPVEVWGADPSNSACTYAFLDDGSDSSIITKGLMRKLGLMHSDDHCKVITANSVSDHQIVAAPLHVKGVEEEQIFCFKDVVVFDELTDISESIPTNKVARMYPHLKDIEFPELSSNSVELLLGNDTHEAFKIVDQRYGEYGQPFGLKTMLGWTLFGADSSMKKIECECSKAIHVNFLCNSEPTVSCDHVLQNPADIASRGLMPSQREKAKMWFEGPQFLYKSEDEWPTQPCVLQKLPEDDAELKRKSNVFHVVSQEDVLNRLISKYSSLISLQKAVAWLTRFKRYLYLKGENCENLNDPKFELTVSLTAKELNDALLDIVRFVQHDVFAEEIEILHNHDNFDDLFQLGAKSQLRKSGRLNSLRKLSPVVVNGIMYVGGRLQKSPLTVDEKHQIILPSDHHFTKLIIDYYHKREGHCGTLHVLSAVRERFWVIKGQSTVRKTLTDCRICRFWKAKPGEQIMAPLPAERVTPGNAAFSHVGVDYMGPLMVKLGRSTVKRYACVFTCLATRAVHIEVAYSLETDSFLNAYHRFCSRRGTPKSVYSDNGTNFTGAERELRECLKKWQQSTIHDTLCQQGVEWKFSPPAASHQGGVWERMIRSIRKIMRSLVGDKLLDDESLYTFLLEVERILNNRPLTPVSDDPRDLNSLTPNMLLLGKVDSSLPIDNFVKADGYKKSWRLAQLLADEFWKRWTREYLPLLQLRQKWFLPRRNFKVGDLVLLIDENTKRGNWPKGLIEQCFPDASGVVRRVKIKTANNTYLRDIRKVCLLEAVD